MRVEGMFYVNDALKGRCRFLRKRRLNAFPDLVFDELEKSGVGGHGGFIPAVQQIANVATLPGIVGKSLGMPGEMLIVLFGLINGHSPIRLTQWLRLFYWRLAICFLSWLDAEKMQNRRGCF